MLRPERQSKILKNAAIAALLLAVQPFFAGSVLSQKADPFSELEKLRKALVVSSEKQNEIANRLQLLSSEITALKGKSVQIARKVTELDRQLLETEEKLADIAAVEKQTLQTLGEQNEGLADTLSALLQLSRQPEESLIGSSENLINTLRTATLLKAAIPALKLEADQLGEQLDTLANLRDQSISEQKNLIALKSSRKSEQKSLDDLLESKRAAQAALTGLSSQQRKEQRLLSREAKDLVALIDRLEKAKEKRRLAEAEKLKAEIARQEEEVRKLAAARLLAEKRKREEEAKRLAALEREKAKDANPPVPLPVPSHKSARNTASATQQKPVQTASLANIGNRRPFSKAKGTLPLPVGGRIVSKYNNSKAAHRKNGIVIETRGEAAVISPYDGQIAFAGPFRNYGLLLIIDHGEGYHTLLAGMGSIDGSVGQLLLAGEPVGQMKNDKSGQPTLYMELRVKGSPINPVPWLAMENRKVSG